MKPVRLEVEITFDTLLIENINLSGKTMKEPFNYEKNYIVVL